MIGGAWEYSTNIRNVAKIAQASSAKYQTKVCKGLKGPKRFGKIRNYPERIGQMFETCTKRAEQVPNNIWTWVNMVTTIRCGQQTYWTLPQSVRIDQTSIRQCVTHNDKWSANCKTIHWIGSKHVREIKYKCQSHVRKGQAKVWQLQKVIRHSCPPNRLLLNKSNNLSDNLQK